MKIVKTVSGSTYFVDEESKTFLRIRGENEDAYSADNDGTWVKFDEVAQLEVGKIMEIYWTRDGASMPTIRMTTPVTSIEDAPEEMVTALTE